MIASQGDPFPQTDLETNRGGHLTGTQRTRLQGLARAGRKDEFILAAVCGAIAVFLLAAAPPSFSVLIRLVGGAGLIVVAALLLYQAVTASDSLAKDLRSGRVERVEGAIGKDSREQEREHSRVTLYYLEVAGQRFDVDETTYRAAPDAGIVALYILPRSHVILNLERLPDRPLPAGATTSPSASIAAAITALTSGDSVKSAEARAEMEAIGNAMHAERSAAATPPPASERDPRPLAEAILGTWQTGPMSMTFMPDGSMMVDLPGGRQSQGRWSVGSDGRLHANASGRDEATDAWVAGNALTISQNGQGMVYRRAAGN
jgi:hypothetical protein